MFEVRLHERLREFVHKADPVVPARRTNLVFSAAPQHDQAQDHTNVLVHPAAPLVPAAAEHVPRVPAVNGGPTGTRLPVGVQEANAGVRPAEGLGQGSQGLACMHDAVNSAGGVARATWEGQVHEAERILARCACTQNSGECAHFARGFSMINGLLRAILVMSTTRVARVHYETLYTNLAYDILICFLSSLSSSSIEDEFKLIKVIAFLSTTKARPTRFAGEASRSKNFVPFRAGD
jgi:hypothetical protein